MVGEKQLSSLCELPPAMVQMENWRYWNDIWNKY